jgi:hypothetical protein
MVTTPHAAAADRALLAALDRRLERPGWLSLRHPLEVDEDLRALRRIIAAQDRRLAVLDTIETHSARLQSPAALAQALRDLAGLSDPETSHIVADELLLAFIGDPAVRAAFDAIFKWYS